MGLEEQIHEQALDRLPIVSDLVVARCSSSRSVLQPVQGGLAGERRAIRAFGLQLPGQHGEHRIVAQLVVVDEIFVAESDGEHPLADQRRQQMLHQVRTAMILETGGEPLDQSNRLVSCAQQQHTGVRGHRSAVKCRNDPASVRGSEIEAFRSTLCRHRGDLPAWLKYLQAQTLLPLRRRDAHNPVRDAG